MRAISLCLAVSLLVGCGDDDPAPTVEIMEVTPESLDPSSDAADDLSIVVRYADSDGDLGGGTADVHDCRAADLVTSMQIPPIASEEAVAEGVAIEGMLELVVADIGDVTVDSAAPPACADLGVEAPSAGQAVFCVILTDAAGNAGVGDCTDPVAFE